MEKLPMCRICLVQNVRMFLVVNRNLHELYEKLTDIPFVTEDRRPILACFFCCAKLKQCYQLLRQCLEAEELFAQMMNEDDEPNPLINQDHFEFCSGFVKSPIENISIVDECQTENIDIKEELPAVCEGLDDIIELKEEHQSEEIEPENLDNKCIVIADIPPPQLESDLDDDVPLVELKTEEKRRARETKRVTVAEKQKLETRKTKLQQLTIEQSRKDKADSKVIRTTQNLTSKPGTSFTELYKSEQRSFNPVKKMLQHTRTHIGEKPYKCDVCQCSFSHKNSLTRHIRIHTGDKLYKCDVCQRTFNQKSNLTTHIRQHTGEKPYKCDICRRSFSVKGSLTYHIRVHTGDKPYKCDVCQRSFKIKGDLKKHIRQHTGDKPYKCEVCQRTFSYKSRLTSHIRIHTGVKLYKCDVCQRSFSQKYNLKTHIRIHTGENPYKCDVCQRTFRVKSFLTSHSRIHTGVKLYKCDVCQRSFNQKQNLKTHNIRIHSGEKPYKCDVCQRTFSDKSYLTSHIRIHTGGKHY